MPKASKSIAFPRKAYFRLSIAWFPDSEKHRFHPYAVKGLQYRGQAAESSCDKL